jgi:hypothetical protein
MIDLATGAAFVYSCRDDLHAKPSALLFVSQVFRPKHKMPGNVCSGGTLVG